MAMKYLKIGLTLILTALLLLFFFKNVEFARVIQFIKQVNPVYPLLFAAGSFAQFFIRGYRWGIILKPHKPNISLFALYEFTLVGYFINMFLPGRLGEPAKGILIARRESFPPSHGLASVVWERLIDVFMLVFFFLVSLAFIPEPVPGFLTRLKKISFIAFPVLIMLFVFLYFLSSPRLASVVGKWITRIMKVLPKKIRSKAQSATIKFIEGLRLNLSFADFVKLFIASIAVWGSLIPCYWILMKGFGIEATLLETLPYFSIIAVAAAVPTPGMAGSIDAASKLALVELFDVPVNTAAAYTILFHFLVLALWSVFGLIAFVRQGLNMTTIKKVTGKKNEMP